MELVRVTSTSGSVAIVDKSLVPVQFAAGATLQIANEINAVVQGHTTQLSNLDGRVTTNTNNITSVTQTANGLSSTVQSHTTSINTLNGTISGHTTAISNLQQTANGITSMVESISVGGRNILRGTRKLNLTYCTTSGIRSTVPANEINGFDGGFSIKHFAEANNYVDCLSWDNSITPEPDTYYTLSFWCKGIGQMTSYFYPSVVVYGYNSDGDEIGSPTNTSCGDGAMNTTLTNEWRKVWIVWKTGTNMTSGLKNVLVCRVPQGATTNYAQVCGVKFEKGNLATDYTEAPEDLEDKQKVDANIFKGASYDGGYISATTPENKWEFVPDDDMTNYSLYELNRYGTLFMDGSFSLTPYCDGTAYLYSPYFYSNSNVQYTMNIDSYDWGDNDAKIHLMKFSSAANAKTLTSPTVIELLPYSTNRSFTISAAGYYRIRFSTTVQYYDEEDGDYYYELFRVRLYKGKLSL